MSNVIPPAGQKTVKRMYRARFLVAFGLMMSATALLAFLALLPSYLALQSTSIVQSTGASPESETDRDDVARAQTILDAMSAVVSSTSPTDALTAVLAAQVPGVRIDQISYTLDQPSVIAISGSADTPVHIDTYRKAIASNPLFTDVAVPVGDLVGAQNGDFSMTIKGNF